MKVRYYNHYNVEMDLLDALDAETAEVWFCKFNESHVRIHNQLAQFYPQPVRTPSIVEEMTDVL